MLCQRDRQDFHVSNAVEMSMANWGQDISSVQMPKVPRHEQ